MRITEVQHEAVVQVCFSDPARRSPILCFQDATGGEKRRIVFHLSFGMELQGRSRQEVRERTSYFLEVVGLADAARRMPRELSGGMQQRVAIARALAAEPKLLLLDEPFGALDIQIRESMQEFLHQLWRQTGLTALLITHDLEEALLLANRVHILAPSPGRIVRSVDVDLDRSNLAHLRLTAQFLALREDLAQCLRSLDPALSR